MRILYVCQDAGIAVFGRKGASTHIREVCRAWLGLGHDVQIVCAARGPDPDAVLAPHVTVVSPAEGRLLGADVRRLLTNGRFARRLPALAASFRPDLVYERHSLYTGAATRLARRLAVPHMLEANALLSDEQRERVHFPRWAARRERWAFAQTDQLIAVSPGLRAACERWGIPGAKITTLPMAVDPEHFAPRARDPQRRASWGWRPDDLVVGYLGALTGWHRPNLLLKAAAQLAERHPRLRLLFVGGSPHHVEQYRRQTSALGLSGCATFLGAIPYPQVPDMLSEVDIGVVPGAHQWSTPTKMFEYGAMAIPFIAPATENIAAVVEDGGIGLLFPAGDAGGLALALDRLLSDADLRRRLGDAARARILERHTWRHHAGTLLDLGQELLAKRR